MVVRRLGSTLLRHVPKLLPDRATDAVEERVDAALDWAVEHAWDDAVERAAAVEGRTVDAKIKRLTKDVAKELGRVGAATGGIAAVPTVGTGASLATSVAEFGWFTKRAAELILAIAVLRGHTHSEVEERRAWVLAVLVFGDGAAAGFTRLAGEAGSGLGLVGARSLPASVLRRANSAMARSIATRYGTRRGAIALGSAIPFGFGALIGGTANWWTTRRLAKHADAFFRRLPQDAARPEPADPAAG
ncbi:EcsC family protein [Ilumatobacter sp.]|uniref:EcsC family protein n=1 Tax=Ilumatobacter sp. TaxID=1967498 RepID=UPI003B52E267